MVLLAVFLLLFMNWHHASQIHQRKDVAPPKRQLMMAQVLPQKPFWDSARRMEPLSKIAILRKMRKASNMSGQKSKKKVDLQLWFCLRIFLAS